ncbi:MAG: class I SAM-dependent methyltransferase, partial [Solirubrobacteraceae bacterium]
MRRPRGARDPRTRHRHGRDRSAVLERHPGATLIGIDASEDMLVAAREAVDAHAVQLQAGRLEDALPRGPFDLVVSALAVHHLDAAGKADLFARIASVLRPGGSFVLADVVVSDDPAHAVTPLDPSYDLPDTVPYQLRWLADAGSSPARRGQAATSR